MLCYAVLLRSGYKQRGLAAEEAMNVFIHLTYDGEVRDCDVHWIQGTDLILVVCISHFFASTTPFLSSLAPTLSPFLSLSLISPVSVFPLPSHPPPSLPPSRWMWMP